VRKAQASNQEDAALCSGAARLGLCCVVRLIGGSNYASTCGRLLSAVPFEDLFQYRDKLVATSA
jgi:hypothetical protein